MVPGELICFAVLILRMHRGNIAAGHCLPHFISPGGLLLTRLVLDSDMSIHIDCPVYGQ